MIGIYKFYENWSTETFREERVKEVGWLIHLPIFDSPRTWRLTIADQNVHTKKSRTISAPAFWFWQLKLDLFFKFPSVSILRLYCKGIVTVGLVPVMGDNAPDNMISSGRKRGEGNFQELLIRRIHPAIPIVYLFAA